MKAVFSWKSYFKAFACQTEEVCVVLSGIKLEPSQAALGCAALCSIPYNAVPPSQEGNNVNAFPWEFSLCFGWVCDSGLAVNCPSAVTCPAWAGCVNVRLGTAEGLTQSYWFQTCPSFSLEWPFYVLILELNFKELHLCYGVAEKSILQKILRARSPLKSQTGILLYLLSCALGWRGSGRFHYLGQ